MSDSQSGQHHAGKMVYATLGAALKSKKKVSKTFGKRFKKLRIYRTSNGWCLTKWTKGTWKP